MPLHYSTGNKYIMCLLQKRKILLYAPEFFFNRLLDAATLTLKPPTIDTRALRLMHLIDRENGLHTNSFGYFTRDQNFSSTAPHDVSLKNQELH